MDYPERSVWSGFCWLSCRIVKRTTKWSLIERSFLRIEPEICENAAKRIANRAQIISWTDLGLLSQQKLPHIVLNCFVADWERDLRGYRKMNKQWKAHKGSHPLKTILRKSFIEGGGGGGSELVFRPLFFLEKMVKRSKKNRCYSVILKMASLTWLL